MVSSPFFTWAFAFALAAAATPLVRAYARHIGAVAAPKKDRWHQKPTAMMGGVAIFAATIGALLMLMPQTTQSWVVIAASTALFAVGLVDDFIHLKPYQKLIGQLLGASAVIYFGLVLPWTGWPVLNIIITFVWLIGVTNAVNMLDNMDGLSVGVAAIASVALAVTFFLNGQLTEALMLSAFCGALLGFLIYNHNPASIFMGDCGSLFVGFFLASTALLSASGGGGRSRSVIAVLAVPVLVLCIPIFDTTFVTLMRKMSGRAASQGGRDHTSHRLVALGLTERHAVWMLYGFAILGGALAIFVRHIDLDVSIAAIAGFAIVLGLVGVHLGGVRVYSEEEVEAARRKPVVSFLIDLSYKRRVFEVLLDVALIVLASYAAYALVFGPARSTSTDWQLFLKTLPAIVFAKLATFLAVGVYRGLWRYAGVSDVVNFAKAVTLSSMASMLLLVFAFRFEGFSRTVFVLDGMLLFAFMAGSRFVFRFLRKVLPAPHARTAKRALIYGAGDAGELLWRELNNNSSLGYVPVGFVDDDPHKVGKLMHGLRVHSGESLAEVVTRVRADEVFLSTDALPRNKVMAIVTECETAGAPVKRMRIEIERVADAELGWVLPTHTPHTHAPAATIIPVKEKIIIAERPQSH
ncbi:MAG TPA: glycosyl transferase [Thermoanaerobaculia bacterium]|jgi:UDP-GlcNAc:undecaprenyl-phosphate GlcNAc-1-phosphate transferase